MPELVNNPVNLMRVYVTPAQYDAIQSIALRLDCGPLPTAIDGLQMLLSQCANKNGGWYDPARHRAGVSVELIVVV